MKFSRKDIADAFRANDVAVLEQNRTVEYEERAPHPDGLHAYISMKFPLCDHTGKAYATCGISTDITERKRAEDELRANESRVRLALLAAPVGLWGWDVQTDHLYWSPQVDVFLGVAPGSIRGTRNELLALIDPDDRDAILRALRRALEPRRIDVDVRTPRPMAGRHAPSSYVGRQHPSGSDRKYRAHIGNGPEQTIRR